MELDDLGESCALCHKQQNSVIFLSEQSFLVNICGHKFCASCVKQELHKKRQFACPRCSAPVSEDKVGLKVLIFEEKLSICCIAFQEKR
jgi:hypothetical protein